MPRPPPLDPAAALFLDIDGTLLEIAERPDRVVVPAGLPRLLAALAGQRGDALALVSGRPLAEIARLLGWRGAAAGLHGAERRRPDGSLDRPQDPGSQAALDRLRPRLAALAAANPGLEIEDKGASLALHYRAAPDREPAAAAAARLEDPALRVIRGKMVVEWQPRGRDKGRAVADFMAEPPFCGRPPVYLGDDTTDEDAFAEIERRGGTAILVGAPRPTRAAYRLPSVAAVLAWLRHGLE